MSLPKFPGDAVPPGLGSFVEGWHAREPDAAVAWVMQNSAQPWWPRAVNGLIDAYKRQGRENQIPTLLGQFSPEIQESIRQDRVRPKPKQTASLDPGQTQPSNAR